MPFIRLQKRTRRNGEVRVRCDSVAPSDPRYVGRPQCRRDMMHNEPHRSGRTDSSGVLTVSWFGSPAHPEGDSFEAAYGIVSVLRDGKEVRA